MHTTRLTIAILLLTASLARAELRVGTLSTTERVLREEMPPAARSVAVYASRNEWRGFQILMRSDSRVSGVTLTAGDLHGAHGAVIPARSARLYREHQLHITKPTYRNTDFKPGWYPDALIPFSNPVNGSPLIGARFAAVPFDLPANETHGFWVDLFVPRNTPPGVYHGQYTIRAVGRPAISIPVTLTVWDILLPESPTLRTCFGTPRLRGYYEERAKKGIESPPTDWHTVDAQCAEMLSEHRINATPDNIEPHVQPDGTFAISSQDVTALRRFVDRYHINLYVVPDPKYWIKDPGADWEKLHSWLSAWDRAAVELNRPNLLFCVYLIDEPNTADDYHYVQRWGRAIRAARSVVKVMVTEQPHPDNPAWGDLYGAVDIWCPLFSLFDEKSAAQRQMLGEEIWSYTALCQGKPTPWWHTDYPLLNYRAPAWINWRYRIRGLLYWGGLSYWDKVDDPWTDPATYGSGDTIYNGEGSIVYPARPVGYDGIVPSMRLKALRDSVEDYEYMAILERAGKAAAADKVVRPLAESWFQWDRNPVAYEKARVALAHLIMDKSRQSRQQAKRTHRR